MNNKPTGLYRKCKGVRQQMKCPLSVPIEPCVSESICKKTFLVWLFSRACVYTFVCAHLMKQTTFSSNLLSRFSHPLRVFLIFTLKFFHTHLSHASMNNGAFQPHFLVSCLLLEVFVICKALTFNESF